MRVLVIGDKGQVGRELMAGPWPTGTVVDGLDIDRLDITDSQAVDTLVAETKPDVIVNAAAYTQVDLAESEPEACFAANEAGTANLARAAFDAGALFVHLSTDYVFDGTKDGPYTEDDPVAPLSVYGVAKEAGERAVREICPRHLILRSAWAYSVHGHNFVKTMLKLGAERDEFSVVADQVGTPTSAAVIANAIVHATSVITKSNEPDPLYGTYHLTCQGRTSWFEFASAIFDIAGPHIVNRPKIHAIATADYPTPAKRPANSVLDCSRFDAAFGGERPPWRDALAPVVKILCRNGAAS